MGNREYIQIKNQLKSESRAAVNQNKPLSLLCYFPQIMKRKKKK